MWVSRANAVGDCDRDACPLYPYRLGRNPSRTGIGGRPQEKQPTE